MVNNLKKVVFNISSEKKQMLLAFMLGWQDVKQRYRRSKVGPFWLTLSMGIMIVILSIVFSGIANTSAKDFIPYLAAGIIIWTFISTVLMESCLAFINAENLIKQLPLSFLTHIYRVIWRNLIILAHNLIIMPLVFLFFYRSPTIDVLLIIPGIILIILNLVWMSLILAILCTRFRDLTQITSSLIQILFYITPIIWLPSMLPGKKNLIFTTLNPFFHLIEIIRSPLLGGSVEHISWFYAAALAVMGWIMAILLYRKYKNRFAYWL
jgi:ABC-type polysaccharide/polyol phosphate export permease